jgi:hypothetical protein
MDILPIQASAVPCERVFSSAKETTTLRRSLLGANTMEALQMLKFSLRKDRLNFTDGTSSSDVLDEMEMAAADDLDIGSFMQSLMVGESLT